MHIRCKGTMHIQSKGISPLKFPTHIYVRVFSPCTFVPNLNLTINCRNRLHKAQKRLMKKLMKLEANSNVLQRNLELIFHPRQAPTFSVANVNCTVALSCQNWKQSIQSPPVTSLSWVIRQQSAVGLTPITPIISHCAMRTLLARWLVIQKRFYNAMKLGQSNEIWQRIHVRRRGFRTCWMLSRKKLPLDTVALKHCCKNPIKQSIRYSVSNTFCVSHTDSPLCPLRR